MHHMPNSVGPELYLKDDNDTSQVQLEISNCVVKFHFYLRDMGVA